MSIVIDHPEQHYALKGAPSYAAVIADETGLSWIAFDTRCLSAEDVQALIEKAECTAEAQIEQATSDVMCRSVADPEDPWWRDNGLQEAIHRAYEGAWEKIGEAVCEAGAWLADGNSSIPWQMGTTG